MALWPPRRKEDLPEEIRDLTPEQLVDAVRRRGELEQTVQTLTDNDTARQTSLQTTQSELQQVRDELARLQAAPPPRREERQQQQQQGITSVIDDEDAAFNQRLAPLAAVAFNTGAITAKMSAKQDLASHDVKLFNKFEAEVDGIMQKESPDRRIFPMAWKNAFIYVKGLHADEIARDHAKHEGEFFTETPSSGQPPAPPNPDEVGEDERSIANNFRIDPSSVVRARKELREAGIQIRGPRR